MATKTAKRPKAKKSAPKKASAKKPAAKNAAAPTPPTGPGTWCWHELLSRDVPGSVKFYTSLFGWKTEEMKMPDMTYTLFNKGKAGLGGLMAMDGPNFQGVPPHWLTYVEVADVDASAAKAASLGAKVNCPPMDIPNIGRFAALSDPQGAAFAIFTPKMPS